MSVEPTPIVYVVSRWGAPTQTFVRREARAVAALGIDVVAWSIKRPVHVADGIPVLWLSPLKALWRAIRSFVRQPRQVVAILREVARASSARNLVPQLWASCVGVAWASRPGERHHLHCHFGWVAATSAWASSRVSGSPYSVVLHAFDLHTDRLVDRFTPVPLEAASQVFTISDGDRTLVARRWGVDAEVLRMGVPAAWMATETRSREPDLVVSVGSLVPKKGHDDLIRAFARLESEARLVIVGEGSLRPQLEELVGSLGLEQKVSLVGHLHERDVRDLLDRAAVFALACVVAPDGDRDGIPVAMMEAMARGAPVVTTTVSGIPELVEGVGRLVRPGDVAALAATISELLADPMQQRHLADAARARIAAAWTVEASAPKVAALSSRPR